MIKLYNKPIEKTKITQAINRIHKLIDQKDYVGTDHWIIKREYAPKSLQTHIKKLSDNRKIDFTDDKINYIIGGAGKDIKVEPKAIYYDEKFQVDRLLVGDKDKMYRIIKTINIDYYEYLTGLGFEIRTDNSLLGTFGIFKDNKLIGIVMPVKNEDITDTEDLKKQLVV